MAATNKTENMEPTPTVDTLNTDEQLIIGSDYMRRGWSGTEHVKLISVRRDKVKLREEGRADSFTISLARFKKFYTLSE